MQTQILKSKKLMRSFVILLSIILLSALFLRYRNDILYHSEIAFAKDFLQEIVKNDKPSAKWRKLQGKHLREDPGAFYAYKVVFVLDEISKDDINSASAPIAFKENGVTHLTLASDKPDFAICCKIYSERNCQKADLSYGLSCVVIPDLNNDKKVNILDVKLAKKYRAMRHHKQKNNSPVPKLHYIYIN